MLDKVVLVLNPLKEAHCQCAYLVAERRIKTILTFDWIVLRLQIVTTLPLSRHDKSLQWERPQKNRSARISAAVNSYYLNSVFTDCCTLIKYK